MPSHPKISAALNNCPLHVLTPELRSDIQHLAENENGVPAQFKPAYETLKAKFLAFYLPGKEAPCSWQEFHDYLLSYNEFDIQILFGPVLREVMAENMRAKSPQILETYGMSDEELETFIHSKTSLQKDGRYNSLSPDEVFAFVAANFGLRLAYHQGDQIRTLPDDGTLFEGRPTVPMFHQGGVEGASAGGHWERTLDEAERMDYAQELNAHLHMVAELFRQDSLEVTQAGFELLRMHVKLVFDAQHISQDFSKFFDDFNLTTSQIEKFLYNRLWVKRPYSFRFLGLTDKANAIIGNLSDLESLDYDPRLSALLDLHQPDSETYNVPTKQDFTCQQYQVALTLLTPAVPQTLPHTHEGRNVWPLRANEISALQSITNAYAQQIVYDEGLSIYLYELCNQREIASNLSPEFIELLATDPSFSQKATEALKERVENHLNESENILNTPTTYGFSSENLTQPNSDFTMGRVYTDDKSFVVRRRTNQKNDLEWVSNKLFLSPHKTSSKTPYKRSHSPSLSGVPYQRTPPNSPVDPRFAMRNLFPDRGVWDEQKRSSRLADQDHSQPVASPWNTYFWLRTMQVFLNLGGICAVIAVLSCPPVAAALGITTVFGFAASEIAVTATFLAGTSALLAASIFAVRVSEGEASHLIPLPTL